MGSKGKCFWLVRFIAAGLIAGVLFQNVEAQQKTEFKTVAGVVIVSNSKKPDPAPGGPSQLFLKEDLVIGRESSADSYLFASLGYVGADDQENIWALDLKDFKVRIFDKTGKLVNTFGKKGQGPGEWNDPGQMVVLSNGTAAILDTSKLTFYSLNGKCLKEISKAKNEISQIAIDSKGTIYGENLDMDFQTQKMHMKVLRYDQSLNPIATIAVVDVPFKFDAISVFPPILQCHVTADDRLIWMSSYVYTYNVLDSDGKLMRKITKDFTPVKISAAEKKQILKQGGRAISDFHLVIPDYFPLFDKFVGDADGRLYTQTYERDKKGWELFDVFDTDGRFIARFSLPKGERISFIKKNKLYVLIKEDEEGKPLIKRYAMEWK